MSNFGQRQKLQIKSRTGLSIRDRDVLRLCFETGHLYFELPRAIREISEGVIPLLIRDRYFLLVTLGCDDSHARNGQSVERDLALKIRGRIGKRIEHPKDKQPKTNCRAPCSLELPWASHAHPLSDLGSYAAFCSVT